MNDPNRAYTTAEQESESYQLLESANKHLRDLVVSLSATLLRNAALLNPADRETTSGAESARLMKAANECFCCARMAGVSEKIAEGLEAAAHEFMAKAVKIESIMQKEKSRISK